MEINVNSVSKEEYFGKYSEHTLEQYKLYLEMADRISSRRQAANSFFLSLNTALVVLSGYGKSTLDINLFYSLLTSCSGVILCYVWYRLILSYKNLNSAKFKVVQAIERKLPLKLYEAEWETVGGGINNKLYRPFTTLETKIPWLFGCIYLLIIAYVVPWNKIVFVLFNE